MYKFVVLFALIACTMAAPEPKPGFLAASPVVAAPVVAAPVAVAHAPVATSYANTYKVSYKSPAVAPVAYAAYAAPVVAHAPVLTHHVAAAPLVHHAAPLLVH